MCVHIVVISIALQNESLLSCSGGCNKRRLGGTCGNSSSRCSAGSADNMTIHCFAGPDKPIYPSCTGIYFKL